MEDDIARRMEEERQRQRDKQAAAQRAADKRQLAPMPESEQSNYEKGSSSIRSAFKGKDDPDASLSLFEKIRKQLGY